MKPLADLTVLDLSQGVAGPHCAALFAEHGARVIKVEPIEGDWIRRLGADIGGGSAYWLVYSRGKESVALDLKKPEARDAALRLAEKADVLVQNARPGAMDRLGLGFEAVSRINSRIVYVSISGYGQAGPDAAKPLTDTVAQARSGLMSITPSREGVPTKINTPLIDAITGLYGFQAAVMALWGPKESRTARHLDISLMQSAAALQAPGIVEYAHLGRRPRLLNPPAGNYATKDGWMAVTLVTEAHFQGLCRAIGQPSLAEDPRFATFKVRDENDAGLRALLESVFKERTTGEWVARITAEGSLASAILDHGDWLADPHVTATEAAPIYRGIPQLRLPLPHLPGRPAFQAEARSIGADTRRVLAEIGLGEDEIARMLASGAAAQ